MVEALQTVLGEKADEAARSSGFQQRRSKLSGHAFVASLVFGWLANPQATLEELARTAALFDVAISAQGLDQRFGAAGAACLEQTLRAALEPLLASSPVAMPLLQRFAGVYVLDSSTIRLPEALAEVWPGGGVPAALKVQVCLDVCQGRLQGPLLQPGRAHERWEAETFPRPAGALPLADLGYFALHTLQALSAQGVFWLSRLKAGTTLCTASGRRVELLTLLEEAGSDEVDLEVRVGHTTPVDCRLVARRVPPAVAEERRRKLHDEARRKGQTVSQERLRLSGWSYYITNVPPERLTVAEAFVLARVRWQIELLFKLWKSHGQLDAWRSAKPWRILCEVYAKLLAMLVQHWVMLGSAWRAADRSLVKAAHVLRHHAAHLAAHWASAPHLAETLALIAHCLANGCRINKRNAQPHTYQLLLDASGGLA